MNEDRQVTIQYNNGKTLKISFPVQIRNSGAAVLEGLKKIMEGDKIAIEAEGRLIVIPWSSVQQVEVTPAPASASLPFGAIKNARVMP